MSKNVNIETMKEWLTFIIAVVACIAGIIFWVQTINDPKFEELDGQITILREEIYKIREDNSKILLIVGRLEGKLEN